MSEALPAGANGLEPLAPGLERDLRRRVTEAQRTWRTAGVSAGVVRDGQLLWSSHVGSARLGDQPQPADDDTQFMIGSVTKTFTALAVMALRDEGRLTLDDPLEAYLPGSRHARIPLRLMLGHASGLQREPIGRIWESLTMPDREVFRAGVEEAEQVLVPHQAFHYSNLAYGLLGHVVETVTGQDWEDVVRARVLDPLGMSRTGLTPTGHRAHGYQIDPYAGTVRDEKLFEMHATASIGGLWSSVADLARYAAYIARPDDRVVAPTTIEEMCRPVIMTDVDAWTGAYGLGFGLARRGERVYVGHGGAMPGFLTGLRVRRKEGVAAVVFANSTSGAVTNTLAIDLVEAVLDAEPSLASAWVPEQPRPELALLLGLWWSEGSPVTFFVREGELWSRHADDDPLSETRYAADGPDRFRAVAGLEQGELLELVRGEDGSVAKLYFATYAVTRAPLSFDELAELTREPG